jgi:uncharacterized membrane protein
MDLAVSDGQLSAAGRSAHDLGAAALFGGNLFARVGMHPALADVSEAQERGQVVNHAWRRYGTVNSASLLAVIAGWGLARRGEAADRLLSPTERRLAHVKDATVIAVALTGVTSAIGGVLFGRMEPDGAVELADGSEPSEHTPRGEARTKRLLNGLGAAHLLSAGALVTVNAALAQTNFRRPPVRRLLRRVR